MRIRKDTDTGKDPRMIEYNILFFEDEIEAVIKELNKIKENKK